MHDQSDLRANDKLRQKCLCRFFSLVESPRQVQNSLVNAGGPGWRPLLGLSEEARNRRRRWVTSKVGPQVEFSAAEATWQQSGARSRKIREEIL